MPNGHGADARGEIQAIPPLASDANSKFRRLCPAADKPGISAVETMELALQVLEDLLNDRTSPLIRRTGVADSSLPSDEAKASHRYGERQ